MEFSELKLIDPLLRAVDEAGYSEPSPIQEKAIPPVLAERDLLACAQTGTGKTAAFALPMLQLLNGRGGHEGKKRPIRALILTPTRELALQIYESFEAYGKYLHQRCAVIFGGVGQAPQVQQLQHGVDVLVATPGRLNDLIGQGYVKLGNLEIFVLDEADRMLDMGFVNDVKKVIRQLPEKRQTLLFSATMPKEIVKLAASLLHNPAKVFVTPPSTTVESIEQSLYRVDKTDKRHLLASLLKDKNVASALVFTRTKHGADRVVRELKKEGVTALAIHGNKSQNARQNALGLFKKGKVRVLVATDIAARGLDISELSHVFNYDLPNVPETYVHRIGRTGRAGHDGIAVSFCCADEETCLTDIQKLIGFAIPEVKGHAWPAGQAVPAVAPSVQQPKQSNQVAQKQPSPARGKQQPNSPKPQGTENTAKRKPNSKTKNSGGEPPQQKQQPQGKQPRQQVHAGNEGRTAQNKERQPRSGNERIKQAQASTARKTPPQPAEPARASSIVTKRPVWSTGDGPAATNQSEGEMDMGRNNRRRRPGKKGQGDSKPVAQSGGQEKQQAPQIKKNERGVFDFSEAELAEDTSLRIVSTTNGETKYANFEDYLKNH